jgi:hypothetical protein
MEQEQWEMEHRDGEQEQEPIARNKGPLLIIRSESEEREIEIRKT